jgi:hypothetical protein
MTQADCPLMSAPVRKRYSKRAAPRVDLTASTTLTCPRLAARWLSPGYVMAGNGASWHAVSTEWPRLWLSGYGHHTTWWLAVRHPRRSHPNPDAGAAAALQLRRDYPMMDDVFLSAAVPALGIAALAGVYILSRDPDRRGRAWQLLKLLLRR